ncbi:MAG: glycine/sarcosine/betaine reductase selenoprotein B family protein, partial [Candidatus Methylomirabilales bacterium]
MGRLHDFANAILVQLYKRVPWLAERWAKHHQFIEGKGIPWAPLRKPLRESSIAMVTTAGVHLKSQTPFNMEDPDGDATFRTFPADVDKAALTITHKYYDHSAADRDINVVLPIDRLRELRDEGVIGRIAPTLYSFMGHIDGPHLKTLMEETAPQVAELLVRDEVDAVFLTPA